MQRQAWRLLMTSAQDIGIAFLRAIGVQPPVCGSVTLNFNEAQIASVETKTKVKVPKRVQPVIDTERRCG